MELLFVSVVFMVGLVSVHITAQGRRGYSQKRKFHPQPIRATASRGGHSKIFLEAAPRYRRTGSGQLITHTEESGGYSMSIR